MYLTRERNGGESFTHLDKKITLVTFGLEYIFGRNKRQTGRGQKLDRKTEGGVNEFNGESSCCFEFMKRLGIIKKFSRFLVSWFARFFAVFKYTR
jgi:hypothetical protein